MIKKIRVALYVIVSVFTFISISIFEFIRISNKISIMEKRMIEYEEELYNLKKRIKKIEQEKDGKYEKQ